MIDDGLINKVSYNLFLCPSVILFHEIVFSTFLDNGMLPSLTFESYFQKCIMFYVLITIFILFMDFVCFYAFLILYGRKNFSWHCSRRTRKRAYLQIGYIKHYLVYFPSAVYISTLMKKKQQYNKYLCALFF